MQFLHKIRPIQSFFLLFTVYRIFLSFLTIRNTSSFLKLSAQLIFSIFLQYHTSEFSRYFWSTLYLSKFQNHTKLCSKCSTLLVSSLKLSPICWPEKSLHLVECRFWHGKSRFNFACVSEMIFYQATQIDEIFHVIQLFLISHDIYWSWLALDP